MHLAIDPKMFDAVYSVFERIYPGQTDAKIAHFVVNGTLSYLMKRGLKRDPSAIRAITKIALEATSNVERLTREEPKKIRELAEMEASFPILISRHIAEKIDLLNIGAHAVINTSGFDMRASKGQRFKNSIHLMCDRLHRAISEVRTNVLLHLVQNQPPWRVKAVKLPP